MKKLATLLLAAAMTLAASGAYAIDFKATGQWFVGFGVGQADLVTKKGDRHVNADDAFRAGQRLRLKLEAVASENLSGTVHFEIGDITWGHASSGGALGADGNIVEIKHAHMDWVVPNSDLSFRMGIQPLSLPNVAGGSSILDDDVAAVVANYKFNDNLSLTAFWARPLNDNFANDSYRNGGRNGYLDNIDLFSLSLPIKFDGFELTPWAMYGLLGKNSFEGFWDNGQNDPEATYTLRYGQSSNEVSITTDGIMKTLLNFPDNINTVPGSTWGKAPAYTSMFFAGLPVRLTAFEPLNIELDLNYGYVQGNGSYSVLKRNHDIQRADSRRSGWLVKALVEYKFDWGVPGIFGWYGSGDDGNMKNGSERMPSVAPMGNFTSFQGDGNLGWSAPGGSASNAWYDRHLSYAGTWGIGLQVRDVSFMEDLTHTFRVAYWGGTNSPSMTKYFKSSSGWNGGHYSEGPYLTTNDGLLEFNQVNSYKIYENLEANLDLGYMVNMVDKGTWNRSWLKKGGTMQRSDAWRAHLTFAYTF